MIEAHSWESMRSSFSDPTFLLRMQILDSQLTFHSMLTTSRLFAGWIDVYEGWKWVMWFGAIVQAAATVIIYFFMEETMYFRNTLEGVDSGDSSNGTTTPDAGSATPGEKDGVEKIAGAPAMEGTNASFLAPRSYWKKLQLFVKMPGRPSTKQLFTMMYRPLLIMWYFPCVTWAGL